jgi:hypothetical protein
VAQHVAVKQSDDRRRRIVHAVDHTRGLSRFGAHAATEGILGKALRTGEMLETASRPAEVPPRPQGCQVGPDEVIV